MAPALYLISGGDFAAFFSKLQEGMKDWPSNVREKGFPPGFAAIMLAYFGGLLVALYFCLRLMVWPPAIVATRRFALGEAWSLTRGNVWRFIGLFALVFFIPYFILAGAAYWYYTTKMKDVAQPDQQTIVETVQQMPAAPRVEPAKPEDLIAAPQSKPGQAAQDAKPADPTAAPGAKPGDAVPEAKPEGVAPALDENSEDLAAAQDGSRVLFERQMGHWQAYAPLMWLIELILYVLATAFGVALLSYSYKALKGYEAHEPIPEDT